MFPMPVALLQHFKLEFFAMTRKSFRRAARALRHFPDRLLHGLRRRRARQRIAALQPKRVLFVCLGNICRSPYAAARYGAVAPGAEVQSAGFIGPGRGVPDAAHYTGLSRGCDLTAHRSQLVTAELLRWADLVVVMDPEQRRRLRRSYGRGDALLLGDLDPHPIDTRTVRDPYDQPRTVFVEVFDRIDRCIKELSSANGSATTG
jgi:protein-tyrosine phosphatase